MGDRNKDIIPPNPNDRFIPLQQSRNLRAKTFKTYPSNAIIDKEVLIDNAFHYIGDGESDEVQCTFCGGIMKEWEKNDNVEFEHRRFFPLCPFVRKKDRAQFGARFNGSTMDGAIRNSNIVDHKITGKVPSMKEFNLRLKSYSDWPYERNEKPHPEDLARAGLFYLGKEDNTQCWCCGNLLTEWEPEDQPKKEHDDIFPECPLVAQ